MTADRLRAEVAQMTAMAEEALAENKALRDHVRELQDKIDAEKSCACSFDDPGAVCAAHSPKLRAAETERDRLREALRKIEDRLNADNGWSLKDCDIASIARAALEGRTDG